MGSLFWLGFALAASPGPDFFLIVHNTVTAGRFLGFATLLGNRFSLCIHISLAVFGLSVALQQSPTLFFSIRILGAAYLIYLGCRKLYDRLWNTKSPTSEVAPSSLEPAAAFRQGFFNNLLNPKVSLFFLSLFPQFTTHEMLIDSPSSVGLAFFVGNTSWWIPLVMVVGLPRLRAVLHQFQNVLEILFGLLFVGFGLRIFWEVLRG